MKKKLSISTILILALLFLGISLSLAFSSANFEISNNIGFLIQDGSQSNPYLISSISEFNSFIADSDKNKENINVTQTADLTETSSSTFDTPAELKANYNANNHSITKLSSNLFSSISGSLSNLTFTSNVTNPSNSSFGLLTNELTGLISNCTANGSITLSSSSLTIADLGGLIGTLNSSTLESISNCKNNATISTTTSIATLVRIGGIVGSIENSATISNCKNTGSISIKNNSSTSYTGGIIGRLSTASTTLNISSCTNTGSISAQNSNSNTNSYYVRVGGILGGATSNTTTTINKSYSTANLTGNSTYTCQIGGLVSYIHNTADTTTSLSISNCYSTGTYNTTSTTSSFIGGFLAVGYNTHNTLILISNSYSKCTLSNSSSKYSYIGGLIGQASKITLKNSFSKSEITDTNVTTSSYLGGLIGTTRTGSIDSFNSLEIINCISQTTFQYTVSKTTGLGGIIGYFYSSNNYTLINCKYFQGAELSNTKCANAIGSTNASNLGDTPTAYSYENSTDLDSLLNNLSTLFFTYSSNGCTAWDSTIWEFKNNELNLI